MTVAMSEAAGLEKPVDVYCMCALYYSDVVKDVMTPRSTGMFNKKDTIPPQTCRTETVRKTDRPKWRTGKAEFLVRDVGPGTYLELNLMSQKLFGSSQLGRARVELMDLIEQPHTDRYECLRVSLHISSRPIDARRTPADPLLTVV